MPHHSPTPPFTQLAQLTSYHPSLNSSSPDSPVIVMIVVICLELLPTWVGLPFIDFRMSRIMDPIIRESLSSAPRTMIH